MTVSRRGRVLSGLSLCLATVSLAACASSVSTSVRATSAPAPASQSARASAIATVVQKAMRTYHLKAVVVKVTEDGSMVADQAYGDSMDGVPGAPATTAIVRGNYPNSSDPIFRAIGAYLVPADAPPQPPVRS